MSKVLRKACSYEDEYGWPGLVCTGEVKFRDLEPGDYFMYNNNPDAALSAYSLYRKPKLPKHRITLYDEESRYTEEQLNTDVIRAVPIEEYEKDGNGNT